MSSQRYAPAVAEFARRTRAALGRDLVDLRLFGSQARGDATPESDIDILVVVCGGLNRTDILDRLIDLAFDVNLAHNVYISPHLTTSDELDDEVRLRSSFLGAALREGIPL